METGKCRGQGLFLRRRDAHDPLGPRGRLGCVGGRGTTWASSWFRVLGFIGFIFWGLGLGGSGDLVSSSFTDGLKGLRGLRFRVYRAYLDLNLLQPTFFVGSYSCRDSTGAIGFSV